MYNYLTMATYEKRENGKWSVRFRVRGTQKRLSGFGTKREAENAYILDLFGNP